jgi:tetratricopeptide (TPR) repeat protein
MSRFYLIGLLFLPLFGWGQIKLKDALDFGDKQYRKGDYYYALDFYQQALKLDPENLDLIWKIAETNKAYKDYQQAEKYYSIVYSKDEEGERYPEALLYFGLMQKQNGKYKEALIQFKTAKRNYSEDKSSYAYKKAAQEVESTNWALKQQKIGPDLGVLLKPLPENINSYDAEFGHTVMNGQLYFSSLKADSIDEELQEVYSPSYHTALYEISLEQTSLKAKKLQELIPSGMSIGNGSFTNDSTFYYSVCSDQDFNYTCAIVFSKKDSAGHWESLDSLNQLINQPGFNTTMPHFSKLGNETVLFFSSNRTGTKGAMDIWYAVLDKNGQALSVENISSINSMENEVCPWYDTMENRLFFSSSWHQGFGGQDVFYSEFRNGKFGSPVNIGLPLNSPAADQYYFQSGDSTFVSSNRLGSLYAKNPTCCSDIYVAEIPRRKPLKLDQEQEITVETVKLPIRLYFENNQPDANTTSDYTNLSYTDAYLKYTDQFDVYKTKVALQRDSIQAQKSASELSQFFDEEVKKGRADLERFTNQVWFELQKGNHVQLMVQGFASPLAKTDYNVHLTKRRIQSLKNYFEEVQQGRFGAAMIGDQPQLEFIEVPMGEFSANKETSDDYYDQKNSVYSKAASQERRIEIIELRITMQ